MVHNNQFSVKTFVKNSGFLSVTRMLSCYIFLVLCVLAGLVNRDFFAWSTWQSMLSSAAPMGVVALGAMVVIISGGLDMTAEQGVAASAAVAGCVFGWSQNNIWLTFAAALLAGALLGVINGVIITKLHIQPFITTLATMALCQGIAFWLNEGHTVNLMENPNFNVLASTLLLESQSREIVNGSEVVVTHGIPLSFIIFLALAIATYMVLNKTKMGVYVYSLGGKEEAVAFAGVPVVRYKILVYMFAGFCTGVGTCITISRVGHIAANTTGATLMDVVGSVIIGGTSVSGGKGYVFGTVMGVLIMVVISQLFYFWNIPTLWRDVFKGAIILFALVLDRVVNQWNSRRKALLPT